jgi:hypothetical protein
MAKSCRFLPRMGVHVPGIIADDLIETGTVALRRVRGEIDYQSWSYRPTSILLSKGGNGP